MNAIRYLNASYTRTVCPISEEEEGQPDVILNCTDVGDVIATPFFDKAEKIFDSIMVSVVSSGKPTLIESALQKLRGKPTRESNQDPRKYKQNFSF